jgi:hypothetical protein
MMREALGDLAVIGGLVSFVVGMLEISHRAGDGVDASPSTESAVREAMRGPESWAVRAEFRRSGIDGYDPRRRPAADFGL